MELSSQPDPRTAPIRRLGLAALAVGVVVLSMAHGCASAGPILIGIPDPGEQELLWPLPPNQPRIQYVRSLTKVADLGIRRSLFRRVIGFLAGGGGDNEIVRPYGVFLRGDRLLVADAGIGGVHDFDLARGSHRLIRETALGPLVRPIGVCTDAAGIAFVSDSELGVVIAFDGDGKEVFRITDPLLRPAGLACDWAGGRIWIADVMRHQVFGFDRSGKLSITLGLRGSGAGEFNFPTNLALAPDGTLYVTDSMNFRVQAFDSSGTFLRSLGGRGDVPGEFARPKGVAVDTEGHVYVVEGLFDAINVFDQEGRHLLTFGGPGQQRGQFWLATGIAIDDRNRIFVADSFNGRVQVFQYLVGALP